MINDCLVSAQLSGEGLLRKKQGCNKRPGHFLIPWDLGEKLELNRKVEGFLEGVKSQGVIG